MHNAFELGKQTKRDLDLLKTSFQHSKTSPICSEINLVEKMGSVIQKSVVV